jgi:hypothetical protein
MILVSDSCLALFQAMEYFTFEKQEKNALPVALKIKHCRDDNRHKNQKNKCDSQYLTHDRPHGTKTD